MLFILLAKILGTSIGLGATLFSPGNPVRDGFLLGVLPIWLELAATWATGREPSLETRLLWRRLDAAVDAASFVLVPALWLWGWFPSLPLAVGLAVFVACGLFRLGRFLRRGLVDAQFFEGLPVTYTGYLWGPCAFLLGRGHAWFACLALCAAAFLMVWSRLKVGRTRTRNDPAPIHRHRPPPG